MQAKLAGDIHTLLSVLEGAEFKCPEMRELLSTTRRNRIQSTNTQSSNIDNSGQHESQNCASDAELACLKESILSLKTDILNMKQKLATSENARSNQVKVLKETVISLKSDLQSLAKTVQENLGSIKLCTERIESEKANGITSLRNEVKQIKESVNMLEESVLSFTPSTPSPSKKQKRKKAAKAASRENSNGKTQMCEDESHSRNYADQYSVNTKNYFEPLLSAIEVNERDKNVPGCNGRAVESERTKTRRQTYVTNRSDKIDQRSSCEINVELSNEPRKSLESELDPEKSRSYADVASARTHYDHNDGTISGNGNASNSGKKNKRFISQMSNNENSERQENHIPVICDRFQKDSTSRKSHVSLDEFVEPVRRSTKRFYIRGFKSTINENKMAAYVNERGPKVTKVSIFRYSYKPLIIRLNVEDDDNARMLDDPDFWPHGVFCRPWYSYSDFKQRQNRSSGSSGHNSRTVYSRRHLSSGRNWGSGGSWEDAVTYNRSDINDYNPYLWYWEGSSDR